MAKERSTPPPRDAANPAAPSASAEETRALGSPPATSPEVPHPKKKIDPWRFGAITVPPGMQAALLAKPLPELPRDRVYRSPTPSADPEESATNGYEGEEEPRIPRRDLRRPVAIAVALLFVAVVAVWVLKPSGDQASEETSRAREGVAVPPPAPSPPQAPSVDAPATSAIGSAVPAIPTPPAAIPSGPATAPLPEAPRKAEGPARKARESKPHPDPPPLPGQARPPAPVPTSMIPFPSED